MLTPLFFVARLAAISDAALPPQYAVDHPSCRNADFEIRLQIENVAKSAGLMVAELYPDKEDGFLSGRTRLAIARFAARAPETVFCLAAPGPGVYALSVYQDENANTEFDRSIFGLPKEPWGISNNPQVGLKGPRFTDALFVVGETGADISIRLRN